ncbi:type II toxin-antitoxin system VapC family toxin [Phyllobacterium sp. SYP-B3895]|uniref:type II toxin-antitoxin system VapC family toxin n=1 Tax=Phyllobacterium sp. SYP-B3895 TaxID=2663240 RepID=UPI003519E12C
MRLLLDPHLILWAAAFDDRLSVDARSLFTNPENDLVFSAASLWEIAITQGLERPDLLVDARILRRGLLDNGYAELAITSEHAVAVAA